MDELDFYDDYPLEDEEDLYGTAASAYDCTGLIPRGIKSGEELESYDDVYPMGADEREEYNNL